MTRSIIVAFVLLLAWAGFAHAEKRVALVIGNSAYTGIQPLSNPKNDATLMAKTLAEVGFEVVTATDVDFNGMRRAVQTFGRTLRLAGKDAVGLLYYAGHGVQARGANYLIPLGADIQSDADLELAALSASQVLAQMEVAGNALNLVILDACRNNPFAGKVRSGGRGLARIQAASGSLIAFAAAPGQVANDGDGANSPYTAALAKAIKEPGLAVEQVFKKVRVEVEDRTGGAQTPWEESSLRGDFRFVPGEPAAQPSGGGAVSDEALELAFWNSVKDSGSVAAFEEFLKQFPDGRFAGLATIRIKELKQKLAVGVFPERDSAPERERKPAETFRDCDGCPEMVVVPAGRFTMGSAEGETGRDRQESPRHEVRIGRDFAVGRFEVTFAEWEACVAGGGCNGRRPADEGWGRGNRPVVNVSWDDAQAYVAWLNGRVEGSPYRLLSEAEWEYAARAGTTTVFSFGDSVGDLCQHGNGADRSTSYDWANKACNDGVGKKTAAVGSYQPNAFGLYDMHGNAWEWTEDCWHDTYRGAPGNGSARTTGGDCARRVMRGGSWNMLPRFIRSAGRFRNPTFYRDSDVGFRVARALVP